VVKDFLFDGKQLKEGSNVYILQNELARSGGQWNTNNLKGRCFNATVTQVRPFGTHEAHLLNISEVVSAPPHPSIEKQQQSHPSAVIPTPEVPEEVLSDADKRILQGTFWNLHLYGH